MDLDRAELQNSVRRMFGMSGLAPDRDKSWAQIIAMGWLRLSAPEELGGFGLGHATLWTIYVELGRILGRAPFLPAMLAIEAICESPEFNDRNGWIERLYNGELVTSSLRPQLLQASSVGGEYVLNGTLRAVPDGDVANYLVVWTEDKHLCGLLHLKQAGVQLRPRAVWDNTRQLFDAQLQNARLASNLVLAHGTAAAILISKLQAHILFALAADSVGGAAALLEITVQHLQTRRQFGRPLAMFQSLKHRCADLKTMHSAAEALLWKSADATERDMLALPTQAGLIKSYASSMFQAVAEEAIQLHGGIGLTAEYPCHMFLKRALLTSSLGDENDINETVAGEQALQYLT